MKLLQTLLQEAVLTADISTFTHTAVMATGFHRLVEEKGTDVPIDGNDIRPYIDNSRLAWRRADI